MNYIQIEVEDIIKSSNPEFEPVEISSRANLLNGKALRHVKAPVSAEDTSHSKALLLCGGSLTGWERN